MPYQFKAYTLNHAQFGQLIALHDATNNAALVVGTIQNGRPETFPPNECVAVLNTRDVTSELTSRFHTGDNHASGGSGRPASEMPRRTARATLPQMARRPIRYAFILASLKQSLLRPARD